MQDYVWGRWFWNAHSHRYKACRLSNPCQLFAPAQFAAKPDSGMSTLVDVELVHKIAHAHLYSIEKH